MIGLADVRTAARRIAPYVAKTPVLEWRSGASGHVLRLKAESLQPVGSFKIRGAFNRMLTLPDGCPGVVAHSSGNHARAVAHAGRILGIPTTVVMPSNAPSVKRRAVEADGARVVTVGPDSEERKAAAIEISVRDGLPLVAPYDDPEVAAGQGTAALELWEDGGPFDRFYCPVSGGGLIAGCAAALSGLGAPEIVGVEPASGDDVRRSLAAGRRLAVAPPATIADGLAVRTPGERVWPTIRALVARVETVTDEELLGAMAFALTRLRIVLEPSGAAALAAAVRAGGETAGVILSGGNVEPGLLAEAARLAAAPAGRGAGTSEPGRVSRGGASPRT